MLKNEIDVHLELCSHKNITKIIDYCIHLDQHPVLKTVRYDFYIVLEKGFPFHSYIERRKLEKKYFNVIEIVDFFKQISDIGLLLEEKKKAHLDIKPSNFLIFPGNILKLTDFGLAKKSKMADEITN